MANNEGIKKAGWVAKIVSDPNNPPNVVMITGVFGDSPVDGHVRIYLNYDLSEYVDVPENAVRHTEDISGDQAPPGAAYIWIDRDVEVIHEPLIKPEPRKAKFLQGRVEQMYARRAAAQPQFTEAALPQPQPLFTRLTWCRSQIDACPSALIQCESQIIACEPSRFTVCQSLSVRCPPSVLQICPTQPNSGCPSTRIWDDCGVSRFVVCQSLSVRCPSTIDNCPSALIECASQYAGCVTQDLGCIPSAGIGCVTLDCPSAVDACPSAPGGCDWGDWREQDWGRRIGGRGFLRRR